MLQKFSDLEISNLFLSFNKFYNQSQLATNNLETEIFNDLYYAVNEMIRGSTPANLYLLGEDEQQIFRERCYTIYKILDIFIASKTNNPSVIPARIHQPPRERLNIIVQNIYQNNRSLYDDYFFRDLLILSAISNHNRYQPIIIQDEESKKSKCDDLFSAFAILIVGAAALFALYYICFVFLPNSFERMWFNEGRLHASINILASLIIGIGVIALTLAFITNPTALIFAGVIALGVIASALAGYLTNFCQNLIETKLNKDSISSIDPYRYNLSASEEQNLVDKGFDLLAVKCAIAALAEQLPDKNLDFKLFSSRSNSTKEILTTIRNLKSGNIINEYSFNLDRTIKIDNMTIKLDSHVYSIPHARPINSGVNNQTEQGVLADAFLVEPSAPPEEDLIFNYR